MTPTKGNGLTTPHSQPAETHKQASNTHDFTADGESAPVGDVSLLRRLQRQFEQAGMRLYPLDGASLLVVHPHYGMSKAIPDIHTASRYLRQIGGR
jgi:hypothetical protein